MLLYKAKPFVPGDFVEQLELVTEALETKQPFRFDALGVRVSVQCGIASKSGFMLEGVLEFYPFPKQHSHVLKADTDRGVPRGLSTEEVLPLRAASHFEVVIMKESGAAIWMTPKDFGLASLESHWTGDDVGRFVPKRAVQTLLNRLHELDTAKKDSQWKWASWPLNGVWS